LPRPAQTLKYILVALVAIYIFTQITGMIAVQGHFAKHLPVSEAGGASVVAGAPGHHIAGRLYLSGAPSPSAPLVVVLHGDAPFVLPRYQYLFASRVAVAAPGARVVALLRPGYGDPFGAKSDGSRGFSSGENYTPQVLEDLTAAIQQLKTQWQSPSLILVGHSGGAAIAADIAGTHPQLVQQLFLVGCPCDLAPFRRHMAALQKSPLWLLPVHSLSPLDTLKTMTPATTITAISGSNDPIALPQYARAYIAEAQRHGIPASMDTLPGLQHEILLEPAVVQQIADAARSLNQRPPLTAPSNPSQN
jgi:pimeloyl-ACP methyl ester carboxylesterase